jgi:hypothetical protein
MTPSSFRDPSCPLWGTRAPDKTGRPLNGGLAFSDGPGQIALDIRSLHPSQRGDPTFFATIAHGCGLRFLKPGSGSNTALHDSVLANGSSSPPSPREYKLQHRNKPSFVEHKLPKANPCNRRALPALMEIDGVPPPSIAFTPSANGHSTLREKPHSEILSRRKQYSQQLKTRKLAPLKRKVSAPVVIIPPPSAVVKPNVSIREIFAKKRKTKPRKRRKTVKPRKMKVLKPKKLALAAPRASSSAPVTPKRRSPVKPKVSTPVKPIKLSVKPEPVSQLSLSAAQRKGLTNHFESAYGQKMAGGGLVINSVEHRGWAE